MIPACNSPSVAAYQNRLLVGSYILPTIHTIMMIYNRIVAVTTVVYILNVGIMKLTMKQQQASLYYISVPARVGQCPTCLPSLDCTHFVIGHALTNTKNKISKVILLLHSYLHCWLHFIKSTCKQGFSYILCSNISEIKVSWLWGGR